MKMNKIGIETVFKQNSIVQKLYENREEARMRN